MKIFGRARRPDLSAGETEALGLGQARVLAWSPLAGAGLAAATSENLHILTPQGKLIVRPWTDVDHAAWDAESSALAVWWVGSSQTVPLEILDQSRLPDVIHERVTASVVLSTEVAVPGGGSVRVALRKAADGSLVTQAAPRGGAKLDDPVVESVVRVASAGLRSEVGLD